MLLACLTLAFAAEDPLARDGVLDRDRLVQATFAVNPEITVAERTIALARAKVDAAGPVPDPMVDVAVAPLSVMMEELGWSVQVEQQLPLWGMRGLEKQMAATGVDVATAGRARMELELASMATMLWVDWWMMHRQIALMDETITLVAQSRDSALRRYAAGSAPASDHLMLGAEAAMMLAEHHAMEFDRALIAARINLLLHRPTDTPLPPPPVVLPPAPAVGGAHNPALAEADAMTSMAKTGVSMARAGRLPMIGWMAGWDAMEEMVEHRLMVGVSVQLPLATKTRAGAVAVAEAEVARAEAMKVMVAEALRLQAEEARLGRDQQASQLDVIRKEMLPAAQARVDAAQSAFSTGSLPSQSLIDAQRGLRDVRLREVQAEAMWWQKGAELALAMGEIPGETP